MLFWPLILEYSSEIREISCLWMVPERSIFDSRSVIVLKYSYCRPYLTLLLLWINWFSLICSENLKLCYLAIQSQMPSWLLNCFSVAPNSSFYFSTSILFKIRFIRISFWLYLSIPPLSWDSVKTRKFLLAAYLRLYMFLVIICYGNIERIYLFY